MKTEIISVDGVTILDGGSDATIYFDYTGAKSTMRKEAIIQMAKAILEHFDRPAGDVEKNLITAVAVAAADAYDPESPWIVYYQTDDSDVMTWEFFGEYPTEAEARVAAGKAVLI